MKVFFKLVFPIICLSLLLSGCGSWMDGEYSSVTPNYSIWEKTADDVAYVGSYEQACDALAAIVEDGVQERVFYATGFSDEEIDHFIGKAIDNIMSTNPIASYAVEDISYETGTNMGKVAVAVTVSYNHSRSEILRIKQAKDINDLQALICVSLKNFDSGLTIFTENYQDGDWVQFVENYMADNPQVCMEMPQMSVSLYPDSGRKRIVEINFTYQTSRDMLRTMQQAVNDVFKSANLYINPGADDNEKYSQLYSFLMERYDYSIETSITPSYSLLRHGVGDSKAFATVYAAICRQAKLDCRVVTGTKAGEPWHWNILLVDGIRYHLDLLECNRNGFFLMRSEDEMDGYVWDFSAFVE